MGSQSRSLRNRQKNKQSNYSIKKIGAYLLGLAAAVGLTYGTLEYMFNDHQPPQENRPAIVDIVRDFPTSIPGAGEINIYPAENSKYCIVHIKDLHGLPDSTVKSIELSRGSTASERLRQAARRINHNEIPKVQEDIYNILNYLIEKYRIKDIYLEGLLPEREQSVNSNNSLRMFEDTSQPLLAIERLHFERRAYVRASETMDSYNKRIKEEITSKNETLKVPNSFDDLEEVDKSEDTTLDMILKGSTPINFLIFGTSHSFGNNVKRRNETYPTEMVSLIEIYPSYIRQAISNAERFLKK